MLEDNLKQIHAFIYLVKNQSHLFLIENRHEDLRKASANFGETEDDIAENILEWCEKYTDIDDALSQTRQELDASGEIAGERNRIPGTTNLKAPPPPPPPKAAKETLLNAIQESFPNQSK